jgi:hypothetical protein
VGGAEEEEAEEEAAVIRGVVDWVARRVNIVRSYY